MDNNQPSERELTSQPSIVIAWDPDVVSEQEYAQIVSALGDMIRDEGGIGVERLGTYLLSFKRTGAYV